MIPFILCLAFMGALGEQQYGSGKQLALLDVKSHVQVIMDAARYYLNEGAPSITKLFIVDNPDEIIRLESKLKEKILADLLDQLVEVWAEMNMRVLNGYKALRSLRDKADILVKKLQDHGLENVLESNEIKERITERVKELLDAARLIFCAGSENVTGLVQLERELLDLLSRLQYDQVKIHILKMVYNYRLRNLLNVSKDMSREEYEILNEIWVMVSAWGKWAVLDLMAFIKEPLGNLHTEVQKYVDNVLTNMQEPIDETLDKVLEVAVTAAGNNYDEELANLFTMMSEGENPLSVLCRQ